jgi:hypothetical protein
MLNNSELEYLNKYTVIVGIFSDFKPEDSDVTVSEYAFYLDRGTLYMPARPFFSRVTKTKRGRRKIVAKQKELFSQVLHGRLTGKQALQKLGEYIVNEVKQQIIRGNFAPLKPATKRAKTKNKNKILQHHGHLLNSIEYRIIRRNKV